MISIIYFTLNYTRTSNRPTISSDIFIATTKTILQGGSIFMSVSFSAALSTGMTAETMGPAVFRQIRIASAGSV